jgi:hypothetical protein
MARKGMTTTIILGLLRQHKAAVSKDTGNPSPPLRNASLLPRKNCTDGMDGGSYNQTMNELSPRQISLNDPFWSPHLQVNAERAIYHQRQMLEDSSCIDNFRVAAGEKEGFREG